MLPDGRRAEQRRRVPFCHVKLCRFERVAEPGSVCSGIVYGDKVYETDGANAIAVHGVEDVRLLSPIGSAPSVRFYDRRLGFSYLNPQILGNPGEPMPLLDEAGWMPCLALVVGGAGMGFTTREADDAALGFALGAVLRSPFTDSARALDAGYVIGPALTTPEELDDRAILGDQGKQFELRFSAVRNEQPLEGLKKVDLPYTVAEVIAHASSSCAIVPGDLIMISLADEFLPAGHGDKIEIRADVLGLLVVRLA